MALSSVQGQRRASWESGMLLESGMVPWPAEGRCRYKAGHQHLGSDRAFTRSLLDGSKSKLDSVRCVGGWG